jgi:protein involved in polysaccharide export with SLBB domain
VQIVGGSAGGAMGRVTLQGYVQNPGPRPLAAATTVRELLGEPDELQLGTYLPMAVLMRRDPVTSARVLEPVNLITALRDNPSVALRSDDRLFVFGQSDIRFLNRPVVRRIILGQANTLPECRSLERLQALVQDTQSPRFTAVTRGSFIIQRGGQADIGGATAARSAVATRQAEQQALPVENAAAIAAARARGAELGVAGTGAAGAAGTYGATGPYGTYDTTVSSDERIDLEIATRIEEQGRVETDPLCPPVFENEPDLLPVLLENAVGIGGAVRQPGAYPLATPTPVSALVSVAQGLTSNAADVILDVTRATGTQATLERASLGSDGAALASLVLRPGDDLRVNAAQPQFEPGGVLLAGEFLRPGLYTIRKGETLAQLIERAGGLTGQAYPYGAIFTRRSVQELQQEGFRRAAREMNNGLLIAATRRNASGDSLAAAGALIERLASVEAPGRVVVEADPRVLRLRPELDTVLEAGDQIVMPKTPNFVLALGDVANPGALQFIAGKSARDYMKEAGGVQRFGDAGHAFLVLPNGTAQPLRSAVWSRSTAVVPPGSTIIVPKDVASLQTLDVIRDVTAIFGQFATAAASIAILATQ